MPASRPPDDDLPPFHDRTERRPFAWGKSPDLGTQHQNQQIVGRRHEIAQVRQLLEASRHGVTGALVLEGESGIGKTTVLEATARMATGFRCLWVHGVESESVLAHAGLLQALTPVRERLVEIPPAQSTALSQALGWGSAEGNGERFLVAGAVLSVLAAESEHTPVLVLVDDLQWVDPESASALGFAARRLRDVGVCFVLAARSGLIPPGLRWLPALRLAGIPAEDARALMSERVAGQVVEQMVYSTGGNPLAMLEVARGLTAAQRVGATPLPEPLPVGEHLLTLQQRHLDDLSEAARRAILLTALNRSGTSATVETALLSQGLDAAAVLDEAQDQDVLVRVGAELAFRHPLLRTAAVAAATATELRSAHRALAEALTADPPSLAEAWHRAEAAAGPDRRLALDLVGAADRSRSRRGYAAASAAMERAAQLCDDPATTADWTATAAADAFLAGDVDRTRSLAARVLDGPSPPQVEGRALFTLGMLEQYAGSVPHSVELLGSAADRLAGERRTRALAELALARFRLNDITGFQTCAAAIEAAADRDNPEQRMLSDFTRGVAAGLGGEPVHSRALLTGVLEQISRPPLRDDPRSLIFLALAGGFLGNPSDVMALGTYQLSLARSRGALGMLVPALTLSAAGRAWLGDHAGAFADAGEAAEFGEHLGYAADTAVGMEMLAWQSAARGLHHDAAAALDRARSLTDRAGTTVFAAHQAITAAFCALCRDDPDTTALLLEARIAADGGVGSMGEPLGVAPDLVEAYLALDRRGDAIALAERFAEATPATAPSWLRALAARSLGLTASTPDAAARAFDAALAAHAEAPDPFETARTHLLYGASLRRSGRRVIAREHLRTAQEGFTAMDLTVWAQRAAGELAATGAAPRSRSPRATEPLTSQETRVALQAAQGKSNKQIAAALFLSPKTVEHHLSSVYRKRGYRSRAELAASFRPTT